MPQICGICKHPARAEIDEALLNGETMRDIADKYGFSRSTVNRHKAHLPAALTLAQEAHGVACADNLLNQLQNLQAKAMEILAKAEKGHDLRTALLAIKEARGCLELLGKLACELQEQPLRVQKMKAEIQKAENMSPIVDMTDYLDALRPTAADVWGDTEDNPVELDEKEDELWLTKS